MRKVAIIGAGPAGLMAAEQLAVALVGRADVQIQVFDAMPSVGRKFLMAGKGGMNITHAEPLPDFIGRYGERAGVIGSEGSLIELRALAAIATINRIGQDVLVGMLARTSFIHVHFSGAMSCGTLPCSRSNFSSGICSNVRQLWRLAVVSGSSCGFLDRVARLPICCARMALLHSAEVRLSRMWCKVVFEKSIGEHCLRSARMMAPSWCISKGGITHFGGWIHLPEGCAACTRWRRDGNSRQVAIAHGERQENIFFQAVSSKC